MSYLLLFGAILSEIVASTFLRLSEGFEEYRYGLCSILLFGLSLALLARAIKVVPLSVAYSLWAGLGIMGTLAAGYLLFEEKIGVQQICGTALIIMGALLVRFSTPDLP